MFLEHTLKFIKGYQVIHVEGYYIERFLNLCLNQGVELWEIRKINDVELLANTNVKDFEIIDSISKTTRCNCDIVSKNGICYIAKRYRKRKWTLAVALFFLILIYCYSIRIWNIEIVGDFSIPIEELYEELKLEGVRVGARKKDIDFNTIKNHIYLRRNDVAWLGFDINGTKAIIEFTERINADKHNDDYLPSNIISNKDGVIYKIIPKSGTKMVSKGDFVRSGDVLISGTVKNKDESIRLVRSDGEILIKTWYSSTVFVPYEKDLINYSGNKDIDYFLQIGKYKINLRNSSTNFEKYDTITNEKKLRFLGKLEFPIMLTEVVFNELSVETLKFTKEQALSLAKKSAIDDMKTKISFDEKSILDDNYIIKENDDGVSVTLTIECIENVGVQELLP